MVLGWLVGGYVQQETLAEDGTLTMYGGSFPSLLLAVFIAYLVQGIDPIFYCAVAIYVLVCIWVC